MVEAAHSKGNQERYEAGLAMRSIALDVYGIPPERVIGSSNALSWTEDDTGGAIVLLRWAGGSRPALRLLIEHDDDEREFAYRRGAEAALDRAAADGWTVVSISADWAAVYP